MDISAVQFLIASQMNYYQTFLHYYTCHLKEGRFARNVGGCQRWGCHPPPLRFWQMS